MKKLFLPSRGPRIMHGAGKLAAQASLLRVDKAQENKDHGPEFVQLLKCLLIAESKVHRVNLVIIAFREQSQILEAEHPARKFAEQIIATFEEAIK